MDKTTPIDLFTGGIEADIFAPNPDDYEDHALIGDCIRGNVGDVVKVHKNDLAILRANKLIADEGEKPAKAAQPKAEKPAKATQPKAEKAAPADLPAVPNIADLPGA